MIIIRQSEWFLQTKVKFQKELEKMTKKKLRVIKVQGGTPTSERGYVLFKSWIKNKSDRKQINQFNKLNVTSEFQFTRFFEEFGEFVEKRGMGIDFDEIIAFYQMKSCEIEDDDDFMELLELNWKI